MFYESYARVMVIRRKFLTLKIKRNSKGACLKNSSESKNRIDLVPKCENYNNLLLVKREKLH